MSPHTTSLRRSIACLVLTCAALLCVTGCLAHHKGALPNEPKEQGAYAELEDARVHYIDVGERDAPLVVLVHGFASSLNAWAVVTPALVEEGYRVVALDLKGFGWTDRPRGDYSPGAQAELVLALLDELEKEYARSRAEEEFGQIEAQLSKGFRGAFPPYQREL